MRNLYEVRIVDEGNLNGQQLVLRNAFRDDELLAETRALEGDVVDIVDMAGYALAFLELNHAWVVLNASLGNTSVCIAENALVLGERWSCQLMKEAALLGQLEVVYLSDVE